VIIILILFVFLTYRFFPAVNQKDRIMNSKRIFLSPPHMGGEEQAFVKQAFESNYIAPLGPQVDAFEKEFAEYVGIPHCVALTSGTAAMHLALNELGVGPGDEVLASTLTFIGSVSPVTFLGATPVFIDADRASWNMDTELLAQELAECARKGKLPKAVVPTDLYGQCCDLERILEICDGYGVPVVCDSAEAAGARFQMTEDRGQTTGRDREQKSEVRYQMSERERNREQSTQADLRSPISDLWHHAGAGAKASVFSFNGNKIITTSGGGMLASDDKAFIDRARKLSQQAREAFPYYEHVEIGFNYRMSNIVAAIGRGQLRVLDERVERKREIFEYYQNALGDLPGIGFMPEPAYSRSNRWLTVILIDKEAFGASPEEVRLALEKENIESRPVWKPMHRQPVFQTGGLSAEDLGLSKGKEEREKGKSEEQISRKGIKAQKNIKRTYPCRTVGGSVAEELFARGLCLPSGTAMSDGDLERVVNIIHRLRRLTQIK